MLLLMLLLVLLILLMLLMLLLLVVTVGDGGCRCYDDGCMVMTTINIITLMLGTLPRPALWLQRAGGGGSMCVRWVHQRRQQARAPTRAAAQGWSAQAPARALARASARSARAPARASARALVRGRSARVRASNQGVMLRLPTPPAPTLLLQPLPPPRRGGGGVHLFPPLPSLHTAAGGPLLPLQHLLPLLRSGGGPPPLPRLTPPTPPRPLLP